MNSGPDNLERLESAAGKALDELRRQHAAMEGIVDTPLRPSVLRLLSHSIALVQRLQRERNLLRAILQSREVGG